MNPQPWYERPGPVFALIGVLLFAGFTFFVSWRTFEYYKLFRSGKATALPQFQNKFTPGKLAAAAATGKLFDVASPLAPFIGNPDAKITIVEFGDYQCEFSKEVYPAIRTTAAENKNLIRYEWRDFPLDAIHPKARPAAVAASCADREGKFWPMQDKLFANQGSLERSDFLSYAAAIGLDQKKFETCFDAGGDAKRIDDDLAAGRQAGVQGTPTFFINGAKVEGAIPYDILSQIITRLKG